ncbi:uncharacterized protein LOC129758526 isoform X2 [Uranotaenia lowii]|uniref:uncharacterized protein LOC129758526 isoform X2 n=1 Tax=Uranotaenia lowii TaxID=190385 RepID=UPI0024788DB3|nr:uncharacterized protein LOC129758526 isoform X2 [Uranotaenia lowii]
MQSKRIASSMRLSVAVALLYLCSCCLMLAAASESYQTRYTLDEADARGLAQRNGEQISARRFKRMYAMCPPHFFRIGNECYFISQNQLNWLDAHFECKDRNSKLAEPMKYDDKNLRKFLTMSKERNYIWIGGNYNWRANKWQWGYNGKDIGYQSFSQMVPGQDLKYHCAVLNPDLKFRWSAKLCTEKLNFICQHKMPFVNSHSRAKVYNRWNATFPNELANEVEVVVADQPRNSKQRDYYSTVSNTTVNPTVLYQRIKNMKHTNRTLRVRPSRRRVPNRRIDKVLPKNDYISNDIYRRPIVEYVQDSTNELNGNGNGHRNGNSPYSRGFNVDIHRTRTPKKHHRSQIDRERNHHQHRHHLGEQSRPMAPATTPIQTTTLRTTPMTTTSTTTTTPLPPTMPATENSGIRHRVEDQQQVYLQDRKAKRDKLRQRLNKLTPEEREQFYAERAKRKRTKAVRGKNETIP